MWKYANASATVNKNVYTAKNIVLTKNEDGTNVLKAALYKQMAGYVKADALAAEKYTVEITKNGEAVTGITADIALISQPTLESDGQLADVTLTGDLKQTATYVVKAVYMHADKTRSTIETTVNVTGMPKLGTDGVFTLPAASKTYTAVTSSTCRRTTPTCSGRTHSRMHSATRPPSRASSTPQRLPRQRPEKPL